MRISFVNFTKTTVAINTKLTSNSFTHHIITFELCWRDGIPFSLCLTAVLVNQTNFGVVKQQHVMKYCQSGAITPPTRRNSCLVTLVPVLLSTLLLISTCVVTVYKAKVHFESGSHLQTMLNFDQCFIFWPIL